MTFNVAGLVIVSITEQRVIITRCTELTLWMTHTITVLHMAMIVTDKFLSLFFPLKHSTIITETSIKRFTKASWSFPIITEIVLSVSISCFYGHIDNICLFFQWSGIISMILFAILPFCFSDLLYAFMLLKINKLINNPPPDVSRDQKQKRKKRLRQKRRIFGLFVFAQFFFFLSILPMCAKTLAWVLGDAWPFSTCLLYYNIDAAFVGCGVIMNPIIYGFMTRKFRKFAIRTIRSKNN